MNLMTYYHQLKAEAEIVLANILISEYNTPDEVYDLLFQARRYLDSDLIQNHFNYNNLEEMLKGLYKTKGTLIKSGLRDLKNETRQMYADVIRSRRQDVIVNLVEKILDFNEQLDTTDMPDL